MYRLYTHNDLDGVGCGIVAKIAFGKDVEVRYNSVMGLDHQIEKLFENEKKLKDDFLIITDLSVNDENLIRLDDLEKGGGKVRLIDHHKTALHFNDYNWGRVKVQYDDGRLTAATSLLYEYLLEHELIKSSQALDEFVELVRQYDTWEWDQNDNIKAKNLNDLFFMVSIEEFEEKMTERIINSDHFEFDDFEQKLLEMEEEKIERYVRRKKREIVQTFIGEYCAGIVHAESYHSELGNELGKDFPHLDYIAILNLGGKKISFRTIHDHVDVSAVAGKFGGGGHAKASGCSMGKDAYKLFVQDIFPLDPMRQDAFRNKYNNKSSMQGSLYENKKGDKFFIFAAGEDNWILEMNGKPVREPYQNFQQAENYIKRKYQAWLVHDDIYVEFLKRYYIKTKN
ncbi:MULTISPECIES: DHH family phosphoesterase [Cytobacillus]|uniref:Oligoribonuclease n=1 Tax=Cytobacillus oceanisediminis 2691 TaxID=1196031 RepID=A0A160MB31_9BACI|nr:MULTISPECIES: oligoribonuclease [Cytobacillus]MBY0156135.1 oligoribonuclease [Cytobacillus firmus]AND40010.1 oligoribonuclease [Cytobacillus oceanisediminis 2691]MCM3244029.1 oligoribonuclease [Cytobacillus oceanisediminis]MCM3395525.1 oligoribonuclease [Cytobacillus oceanisediminis]MCM3402429.1 oligoribonuclease [Cytobacillus oceanisediminis]